MTSNHHPETDVVPLLILIYTILFGIIIYCFVSYHVQITSFLQSFITTTKKSNNNNNNNNNNNKIIRDTVNNINTNTNDGNETQLDTIISKYNQQLLNLNTNLSISLDDISFIASNMKPNSTIYDIILICLCTPTTMEWCMIDYNRNYLIRYQRILYEEEQQKQKQKQEEEQTNNDYSSNTNNNKPSIDVFDELFQDDTGWDTAEDDTNNDTENNNHQVKTTAATTSNKSTTLSQQQQQQNNKNKVLLEGIDEKVLGQLWVENVLSKANVWPPNDTIMKSPLLYNRTFEYNDPLQLLKSSSTTTDSSNTNDTTTPPESQSSSQQLDALHHPAIRRMLCMVVARYNSIMLNNHNELIDAGIQQLIDQTYFKSSMDLRNRITMLFEACIQITITLQCYTLLITIFNTITSFKLGISLDNTSNNNMKAIPWFNTFMIRQYNILPRLIIKSKSLRQIISSTSTTTTNSSNDDTSTDNNNTTTTIDLEDNDNTYTISCNNNSINTNIKIEIVLNIERIHAQQFLKIKMEQLQQQNIPIQLGLQSYREKWWFILRAMKCHTTKNQSDSNNLLYEYKLPDIKFTIDPNTLQLHEQLSMEDHIITACPLMITNIAQHTGQVKIQFLLSNNNNTTNNTTSNISGLYKYYLHIHSIDFLDANQDIEFYINIINDNIDTISTTGTTTTNTTATTTIDTTNSNGNEKHPKPEKEVESVSS